MTKSDDLSLNLIPLLNKTIFFLLALLFIFLTSCSKKNPVNFLNEYSDYYRLFFSGTFLNEKEDTVIRFELFNNSEEDITVFYSNVKFFDENSNLLFSYDISDDFLILDKKSSIFCDFAINKQYGSPSALSFNINIKNRLFFIELNDLSDVSAPIFTIEEIEQEIKTKEFVSNNSKEEPKTSDNRTDVPKENTNEEKTQDKDTRTGIAGNEFVGFIYLDDTWKISNEIPFEAGSLFNEGILHFTKNNVVNEGDSMSIVMATSDEIPDIVVNSFVVEHIGKYVYMDSFYGDDYYVSIYLDFFEDTQEIISVFTLSTNYSEKTYSIIMFAENMIPQDFSEIYSQIIPSYSILKETSFLNN